MTPGVIVSIIIASLALFGWIFSTFKFLIYLGGLKKDVSEIPKIKEKQEQLQSTVDKILGAIFLKTEVSMVQANFGEKHSQITTSEEARQKLECLYERMNVFSKTLPIEVQANRNYLALEISHEFGEEIAIVVCGKENIDYDFALIIASDMIQRRNIA